MLTKRPPTNDSRLVFSYMASLASKTKELVDLELASFGGQRGAHLFALDYIPPILTIAGEIPVALVCKIAYVDNEQVRMERLYWLKIYLELARTMETPGQSAVLTQIAYQLVRGTRAHIRGLSEGRFIQLSHNEGMVETMQASGQRISV